MNAYCLWKTHFKHALLVLLDQMLALGSAPPLLFFVGSCAVQVPRTGSFPLSLLHHSTSSQTTLPPHFFKQYKTNLAHDSCDVCIQLHGSEPQDLKSLRMPRNPFLSCLISQTSHFKKSFTQKCIPLFALNPLINFYHKNSFWNLFIEQQIKIFLAFGSTGVHTKRKGGGGLWVQ